MYLKCKIPIFKGHLENKKSIELDDGLKMRDEVEGISSLKPC
jgi:hypothetical protein